MGCTSVNKEHVYVLIETELGDIKVKLYNETPLHRDNFVKLVKEGYYDGLLFHRVIKDFMIQGGCPEGTGKGGPGYTIKGKELLLIEHWGAEDRDIPFLQKSCILYTSIKKEFWLRLVREMK